MRIEYKKIDQMSGIKLSVKKASNEFYLLCRFGGVELFQAELFCEIFTKPVLYQSRFEANPDFLSFIHILERSKDLVAEYTKSLLEELSNRRYNISTLEIEVSALGNSFAKRIGRQTSGRLKCLYTKDKEGGGFDTICWWHVPCSKRDVNMLFGFFSGPGFMGEGLHVDLKNIGLEPKSFYFKVDHFEKDSKSIASS